MNISLTKIFSGLLFFSCALAAFSGENGSHVIKVCVTGQGCNKSEALEDAFRLAVHKVVGTYLVSQRHLSEEDFRESIYANADAVITDHKELEICESGGIVSLKIEASVVKNDLAKYIVKKKSAAISATDRGNILNRRRALMTAISSLEFIFRDYPVCQGRKINDLKIDADDDPQDNQVKLKLDYELAFDELAYRKFETRLKALLKKVAVAEYRGRGWSREFFAPQNGRLASFNRSGDRDDWPKETKTVAFRNHADSAAGETYHCFAVPNQIYQKIVSLLSDFAVINFQFKIAGKSKQINFARSTHLRFYDFYPENGYYRPTIVFKDCVGERTDERSWLWFFRRRYTFDCRFYLNELKKMESLTIRVVYGRPARYVWFANFAPNERELKKLAAEGDISAMITLAGKFRESRYMYEAALLGSKYARKEVHWRNNGTGILFKDLRVHSADEEIAIPAGMRITSVNGKAVRDARQLSDALGRIPPGSNANLKFSDGRTVTVP